MLIRADYRILDEFKVSRIDLEMVKIAKVDYLIDTLSSVCGRCSWGVDLVDWERHRPSIYFKTRFRLCTGLFYKVDHRKAHFIRFR